MTSFFKNHTLLFLSVLIFLVNLAVRLYQCDVLCFSGDELFTVYFSQFPPKEIVAILFTTNNPPTFEMILHYWQNMVGSDPASLRMLPVFFTSVAAPAIFLIGRKMGGNFIAGWASCFFLLSSFQMEWAHLMRTYSLLVMGSVWSIYFFITYHENGHTKELIGWIFFSLVACVSHYLGWLIICTQVIGWLFIPAFRIRHYSKKFLIGLLTLLLLYSPFGYFLLDRLITTAGEGTYVDATDNLGDIYPLVLWVFNNEVSLYRVIVAAASFSFFLFVKAQFKSRFWIALHSVLILLFFTTISLALSFEDEALKAICTHQIITLSFIVWSISFTCHAIRKSEMSSASKLILLWLMLPIIGIFLLSFKMPLLTDRYTSHIFPALTLLIPLVFYSFKKKIWQFSIVLVAALFVISFRFSNERLSFPDKAMAGFLEWKKPDTAAIWSPGYTDVILTYYFDRKIFENIEEHRQDTSGVKLIREEGYTKYKEGLRRELKRNKIFVANDTALLDLDLKSELEVIYLDSYTEHAYPENGIRKKLIAEFGEPIEQFNFDYLIRVSLFRKKLP